MTTENAEQPAQAKTTIDIATDMRFEAARREKEEAEAVSRDHLAVLRTRWVLAAGVALILIVVFWPTLVTGLMSN